MASLLLVLCGNPKAFSESEKFSAKVQTLGTIKSAVLPKQPNNPAIVVYPLELPGQAQVSLITNIEFRELIEPISKTMQKSQQRFLQLFKEIPAFKTNVRIMDEVGFYKRTGAPAWTNAMYYQGEIIIPVSAQYDFDNIQRSLRHEFSHAVIHALSAGKCPGWLDEGFAQWAEGAENPGLQPALVNWLQNNQPVPISTLQTGFTRLDPAMVPAAYAQSLFASNLLTQTYGFQALGEYLKLLSSGVTKDQAFSKAFGLNVNGFEKKLHRNLATWHKQHAH